MSFFQFCELRKLIILYYFNPCWQGDQLFVEFIFAKVAKQNREAKLRVKTRQFRYFDVDN